MADAITITSTTDSEADVRAALGLKPTPPPVPEKVAETPPPAAEVKPAEKAAEPPAADDDDEDEDPAPSEAEASEAGKKLAKVAKKSRLQTRINELVRKESTTARERDDARTKIEALQAQIAALELKPAPAATPEQVAAKPAVDDDEPKEDDFASYGEYVRGLAKWVAKKDVAEARAQWDKELADQRKAVEAQEAARANEARRKAFDDREAAAAEKYTDYFEVKDKAKDLPIGVTALEYLNSSEIGPELIYYFANNPEEATKIAAMSPAKALLAIGRLEQRHDAGTLNAPAAVEEAPATKVESESAAPLKVPVSQAPTPPPSISVSKTVADKDPNNMSYQEYKTWRDKQNRNSRRAS